MTTEPYAASDAPTNRSFATYLHASDRVRLDTEAATARQERDDALDNLQELRTKLDRARRQRDDLHQELAQTRDALGRAGIQSATASTPELVDLLATEREQLRAESNRAHGLVITAERETQEIATELAQERTDHQVALRKLDSLRRQLDDMTATAAGFADERDQARRERDEALSRLDLDAWNSLTTERDQWKRTAHHLIAAAPAADHAHRQLRAIREARTHRCGTDCTEGGCDFDLAAFIDRIDEILNEPATPGLGSPCRAQEQRADGGALDADALADAMERAESVRIDSRDVVWRPLDDGWHHPIYGTLIAAALEEEYGPTRAVLFIDQDETAPAADVDQAAIDGLLHNVRRSLNTATNDDERAEAIGMLLDGWYAAWPDSALTDPHAPLAGELVRVLGAQEPPVDARRRHALAFNAITRTLADWGPFVALSVREQCAEAVLAALDSDDQTGLGDPPPAVVSSVIAVPSRYARAAGAPHAQNEVRDWVRLRTGSGREYQGHRAAACPGDGVVGHQHDVRCVEQEG